MRRLTKLSRRRRRRCARSRRGGSGSDGGSTPRRTTDVCKSAEGDGPKIGLAYDVGGRGDQSFNDSAYAGLEQAVEEFGRHLPGG